MRRITLVNLTQSPILYCSTTTKSDVPAPLQIALLPSSSTTTVLPKRCSKLILFPRSQLKFYEDVMFVVNLKSLKRSRACEVIDGGVGCPWRIYRTRVSRKHDKFSLFPHRNLAAFLSSVPDTVPISSLLLPGTHQTVAFYGWPVAQCQPSPSPNNANPLLTQLNSGIRALDIRLSIIDDELVAFHGIFSQRTSFAFIIDTLHQFLTAPASQSECIIVSIKQEDAASPKFTSLVHATICASEGGREMWFMQSNRIPTLGEVRGRCVLFSRFGDPSGERLGIHPDRWPDSTREGFEWMCGETVVRVSDWYAIPSFLSIPEKVSLSTSILLPPPPPPSSSPSPSLSVSFFSASSFPLALPPAVACGFGWPRWGLGVMGVNERVGAWLLNVLSGDASRTQTRSYSPFRSYSKARSRVIISKVGTQTSETQDEEEDEEEMTLPKEGIQEEEADIRVRGWAFMDFYEDPVESGLVPLLVECNFRGRKLGEEGWR